MPENFKQPFFSKTISEFWTRWHITLGTWVRDYIYYPVSLTQKCRDITSKARKKIGNYYGPLIASIIALFCVWACNGLWHGAAWSFIFFGAQRFGYSRFSAKFPCFQPETVIVTRDHERYLGQSEEVALVVLSCHRPRSFAAGPHF